MTEPCDLPAVAARDLIQRRALSPVELVESCLARIAAVNHAVNAVVALAAERALAEARAAEAAALSGDDLPPLHGLPLGVKDVTETAGLTTTWGSPLYRGHVPDADSPLVARLRAAGAIVLAKTNTPEWSAGANTRNAVYGATGNPFDPALSAAGSSGGSAVALATGMVPLATGTDMGGSLRNPAAWCGVVGFRPTPALVPDAEAPAGVSDMSVIGPMARSVGDLCLLLSAMVPDDSRDTIRHPATDLASLRAAFTPDFGFATIDPAVRAAFGKVAEILRPAFAVADDACPDCRDTDETFAVLRAHDFVLRHGERARLHPDKVGDRVRHDVEAGLALTTRDIEAARESRNAIARRWADFFRRHDVLIAPAVAVPPRPWTEWHPDEIDGVAMRSYFQWLAPAYAVTVAGHPAVCLPAGRDETGMPFGIQIIGGAAAMRRCWQSPRRWRSRCRPNPPRAVRFPIWRVCGRRPRSAPCRVSSADYRREKASTATAAMMMTPLAMA